MAEILNNKKSEIWKSSSILVYCMNKTAYTPYNFGDIIVWSLITLERLTMMIGMIEMFGSRIKVLRLYDDFVEPS